MSSKRRLIDADHLLERIYKAIGEHNKMIPTYGEYSQDAINAKISILEMFAMWAHDLAREA